ncbi:MAG TPA: DNA mismatch repair endonuclease MutL [Firmicutes bacterium]|nr:DNA mismatch repair endonuclease MutL [Bacillota bacterium]
MGKIRILPEEIISRISAGEVVERPSSVIKELIENSIDAGAKRIDVEVEKGGKGLIKVRDDGEGIEEDDIEKVFNRYSTSKLKSLEDLYSINTLGFRGEALFSICSVSDVILRSKTEFAENGWEIHMRGGKRLNIKPIGMEKGTDVEVRELFFNTPARKKFLKSDSAEFSNILHTFIPYTILFPSISFSLKSNGKSIMQLQPMDLKERIAMVLNLNPSNFIEVEREEGKIHIHCIFGDINIQRAKRDMQFIFVNRRPVEYQKLSSIVNKRYRKIFPEGIFPFFCIFIDIPSSQVDVNIHPAKREVKIRSENFVFSIIEELCDEILERGKPRRIEKINKDFYIPEIHGEKIGEREPEYIQKSIFSYREESLRDKLRDSIYIGSFLNKYLIFGTVNSLLFIDQHAAHERINYEKFKKQIENGKIEIQHLLTPLLMKLTFEEILIWEKGKDKFEKIGFSTSKWDKDIIAINSHPRLIEKPEIAMRNLLSEKDIERYDEYTIAKMACKNSVKAGKILTKKEAEFLKRKLLECEDPFVCPHGRPTVVEIEEKFLDKYFLR